MSVQSAPSISKLFTLYTHMRQKGRTMDDVVQELQGTVYQLPRPERHQLGIMVTDWEAKFVEPEPVNIAPVAQLSPETAFGTRMVNPSMLPGAIRASGPPIACPHCGKLNPPSVDSCQSCNRPLKVTTVTTRRLDGAKILSASPSPTDTAYFGSAYTLILGVPGNKRLIEAYPRTQLTIGRASPQTPSPINIDLAAYNAEALGVSRVHAELRWRENTLLLVDLKSSTRPFINH